MTDDHQRAFIHRVNPGRRGSRADLCYEDNVLITGFSEVRNAADIPTLDELRQAIKASYPNEKPKAHINRGSGLWRFLHEMTPGTLVATPEGDGIHVARVLEGGPSMSLDKSAIDSDTVHRLPVEWLTTYDHPPTKADASPELAHACGEGTQFTTRRVDQLRIHIEDLLDSKRILWRETDPALDALIDKQYPRGTKDKAYTRGAAERRARRLANDLSRELDDDDVVGHEGTKIQYALHRAHERDRAIVAEKKKRARAANHGRLVCEACDYDFEREWELPGGPYVEAHHLVHLNKGVRITRLDDIALLCANCHRAIHRLPSGTPVTTLKAHQRRRGTT